MIWYSDAIKGTPTTVAIHEKNECDLNNRSDGNDSPENHKKNVSVTRASNNDVGQSGFGKSPA